MSAVAAAPEVTLYTTPLCAPCEQVKRYLESRGVAFLRRDLMMDEEAQDRLDAARIRGMPAIEVDGTFLVGDALTREALDRLLGLD